MSTLSHQPSGVVQGKQRSWANLLVPELWAFLAITVMWLAVLVATIWGPDFVGTSSSGDSTTIPSGIAVAFFAFLGTWVVAKYAFGRKRTD
ncbi:MAG: hypothetical protein ACXWZP_08145 [Gaiellaceae bacterium]